MIEDRRRRGPFAESVRAGRPGGLAAAAPTVLQANLGLRCTIACTHCHLGCGPARTEAMDGATAALVLRALAQHPFETLDLTGGAPELNPHFRALVSGARGAGRRVIVRTNLGVLLEPGMEELPAFLARSGVELVASLPCYLEGNVDGVRGAGSFARSIAALRILNALGFGAEPGLPLSLVFNPAGAALPPDQAGLEAAYRRELAARHGVVFTRLLAFANMPVGRFRDRLERAGDLEAYLDRLAAAFNPATLDRVMCRSLVSVRWDGTLHDCDFNLALGVPVSCRESQRIGELDHAALSRRAIAVGEHCYGCAAGRGSS